MSDMKEVNRFFNENVPDYEEKHYGKTGRTFMTVRQERVLELIDGLKLQPGIKALDAGCGPGYLLTELAKRQFQMSGMDGAEEMLKSAATRVDSLPPAYPADFKQGDIEALPYDNESFDLVVSTGVIEYLKDDIRVLADMYRVLKPGGYLVLPVTSALSPINYLDFLIEILKRQDWFRNTLNVVLGKVGLGPILPRHFKVRKHVPAAFRNSLQQARFTLLDSVYFYFLPLPRPFDKVLPKLCPQIGAKMEPLGRTPLGFLGEGYLVLARKPN